MGTNKCASQSGMTAYGTRRHLYDPKNQILPPMDHSTISLQMGTNKCASQVSHRGHALPQHRHTLVAPHRPHETHHRRAAGGFPPQRRRFPYVRNDQAPVALLQHRVGHNKLESVSSVLRVWME